MTLKTLSYASGRPEIVEGNEMKPTSNKVCKCEAYSFPHRLDSGKCRELYNQKAQEEDEWERYFNQRGVNDRAMHQSGMSTKDFA